MKVRQHFLLGDYQISLHEGSKVMNQLGLDVDLEATINMDRGKLMPFVMETMRKIQEVKWEEVSSPSGVRCVCVWCCLFAWLQCGYELSDGDGSHHFVLHLDRGQCRPFRRFRRRGTRGGTVVRYHYRLHVEQEFVYSGCHTRRKFHSRTGSHK